MQLAFWLGLTGAKDRRPAWLNGFISASTFFFVALVGLAMGARTIAVASALVSTILVSLVPQDTWYTRRIAAMATATVVMVGLVFVSAMASATAWAAALTMVGVVFGSALLSLFGPSGRLMAESLPVIAYLFLSSPTGTLVVSVELALATLIGACWAMAISTVTIVLRKDRPLQRMQVEMFDALAAMARALIDQQHGDHGAFVAARRRSSNATYAMAVATKRPPLVAPRTARRLSAAQGQVSQISLMHGNLIEIQEHAVDVQAVSPIISGVLSDLVEWVESNSRSIAGRSPAGILELQTLSQRIRDASKALAGSDQPQQRELGAAVAELARTLDGDGVSAEMAAAVWSDQSPRALLRANLSTDSTTFRHAVRLVVAVGAALLTALFLPRDPGWWVVLTVFIVLKTDSGSTMRFVAPRMAGTIVGVLTGGALLNLLTGQNYAIVIVATALVWFMVALRPVSYLFWTVGVTSLILVVLGFSGEVGWGPTWGRLVASGLGGLIALAATYLVWPSRRGRGGLDDLVATDIEVTSDCVRALLDPGLAGSSQLLDVHRRALLAESNARSAIESALYDPGVPASAIARTKDSVADVEILRDRALVLGLQQQRGLTLTLQDQAILIATVQIMGEAAGRVRMAQAAGERIERTEPTRIPTSTSATVRRIAEAALVLDAATLAD